MTCFRCGKRPNVRGDMFCVVCGRRLAAERAHEAARARADVWRGLRRPSADGSRGCEPAFTEPHFPDYEV